MTTTRGSAHYTGLLPVPVRLTTLENERFPKGQPSLRRALSLLIAFCSGVAATFALWSYGDAARMIASSYPRLGWLAPRSAITAQNIPDTIALAGSAASHPDERDATLGELHAMRLSLDRIAAGQDLITRSIDEIASSIAARQEQMARSTDQTATSIAAGQELTTRSTNQTAGTITTGQGQMTRNADQTANSVDQAPATQASNVTVESQRDAASLQPTARLNIKPTEAKPPEKQPSVASAHEPSCFASASAVLQDHPGALPSWTLRAPGHEGTKCWRAATRTRESDHRSEVMPTEKEIVGTTENRLSPPPTPYTRAPE